MRKKSRMFAIAEALRARRTGVTAAQLAERFGVTLRTIYRDLESLQDAGMPIKADRGRGGGYALDKNYQLPPVNFTAREGALLVALARLAVEQRLIPFPQAIERAADKVKSALSTSAQRELLALVGELQLVGVPALPTPASVRDAVETAWFESRALRIVYLKANGQASPRHIRIRNLVFDRSVTLLNCIDLETGQDRQFRLDKIKSAQVMDPNPS
ncbi:MAG: HTH domain-containing protein [Deltaproteobacteria bacterium]|nr:HTH domain-containing protein [Deltaproteobacteria bacterium]MCW5800778.1 HTH domain-containing protein [Deltaproteobacteria bacterium]